MKFTHIRGEGHNFTEKGDVGVWPHGIQIFINNQLWIYHNHSIRQTNIYNNGRPIKAKFATQQLYRKAPK